MPAKVTIDGLLIDDRNHPKDYQGPYLFMGPDGAKPKAGAAAVAFPHRLTEQVTIRNLTTFSGRKIQTSPDPDFARRVRVIKANWWYQDKTLGLASTSPSAGVSPCSPRIAIDGFLYPPRSPSSTFRTAGCKHPGVDRAELEQRLQPAIGYLQLGMMEEANEVVEALPPEARPRRLSLDCKWTSTAGQPRGSVCGRYLGFRHSSSSMARKNTAITLTDEDRKLLETWVAAHGTPQQVVLRCSIILLKADGMDDIRVAEALHINRHTCRLWRQRMLTDGPSGLWEIAPGRGRKPRAGLAAKVIDATLSTKPKGQTHWSSRGMAREQGIHHSTVARVWSEHEIKPHRHKTFKLSRDANFVPKLVDVVGIYLSPPQNAVVLCVDEKSQIQALDRTQPGLPMKKGRCGTWTHDYVTDHDTLHPGLWLAFGDLNGVDFWRNKGRIEHLRFVHEPRVEAGRVTFAVEEKYLAPDGTEVCRGVFVFRPKTKATCCCGAPNCVAPLGRSRLGHSTRWGLDFAWPRHSS